MSGGFPTAGAPQAAFFYAGTDPIWGATRVILLTGNWGEVVTETIVEAVTGALSWSGQVDPPGQGYGGGAFFPVGADPVGSYGDPAGNVTTGGLAGLLVAQGRIGTVQASHIVAGAITGALTLTGEDGQPQADAITRRFNYILNNTTGVGWAGGTSQGVTAAIQSSGWDEYGRYVEVRVSGTSTANWFINILPLVYANGLGIPTALGKSFTNSIGARLVSGTTPSNITLRSALRNAGGSYGGELGNIQAFQGRLSSERIEVIQSATITSELAVSTVAYIQFSTQLGVTYDLTLRIYDWQQEDGLTRTPVIYTDGSGIGEAGAPGGLVTPSGEAGITSASALVSSGTPRPVVITPLLSDVAQGSVVEAPVRGVTISGATGSASATAAVLAGISPLLITGRGASTFSENLITGLKGTLTWGGGAGLISAQVISSGPGGYLTVEGKPGTVQAGETYPSLGNAFYPMGGYPMAAAGAPMGSVDVGGITEELVWGQRSPMTGEFRVPYNYNNLILWADGGGFESQAVSSALRVFRNLVTEPGKSYRIRFKVSDSSSHAVDVYGRQGLDGTGTLLGSSTTNPGDWGELVFVATLPSSNVLWVVSSSISYLKVTEVSVEELYNTSASSAPLAPSGALTATGETGTITASVSVLADRGSVAITGMTGEESASVQVIGSTAAVVITPRFGSSHAGSTSTGFKGSAIIVGFPGIVEASDTVIASESGDVDWTGQPGTTISQNLISGKLAEVRVVGRKGTTATSNRRRSGRLVTALRA